MSLRLCDQSFYPVSLPLQDVVPDSHPKVQELRELALWSEGMVWSSPKRHGAMTGILKAQIDCIPLSAIGSKRPIQGKTLALMQVLGRWMRMIKIPNQSSLPKAWLEFENGRVKPSSFNNRTANFMEELERFNVIALGHKEMLVDRY